MVLLVEPLDDDTLVDTDRDGVPDSFDLCPWTPPPVRTDRRGCAAFEGGDGTERLEALLPADGAIADGPPTLTWHGNLEGYVVQVDGDTAFDHDRLELGVTAFTELDLSSDDVLALRERFPAGRLFWRVVGSTDGVVLATAPRELNLPVWGTEITLAHHDLNLWEPPHVQVYGGATVTWHIPTEDEGNHNRFRHDVLLVDEDGFVVARSGLLRPFVGEGDFSWTFDEPGRYHLMCAMHSWPSEGETDLESVVGGWIDPGPYRCHSGSITVLEDE